MENYTTQAFPDPEPSDSSTRKSVGIRFILDILQTLVLSAMLFLLINAVSARIRVESISMQPTLYEGDFVFVNRLAYRLGTPGRGDIIIFRYPPDPERTPYIKRVIGLPGDTVRIENSQVLVNEVALREPYIKANPTYTGLWQVPVGALFVLGDNRNSSSDSHDWGMVPLENVIGKAELVYLPFSHWQVLDPNNAAAAEP
jgi:signal peptidase I